jgi:hypothetical protein
MSRSARLFSSKGVTKLSDGRIVTVAEANASARSPKAPPRARSHVSTTLNAFVSARTKAVAASPAVKGKEAAALALLADDSLAGLSADAIIKLVGQAGARGDNADDAALRGMQTALGQSQNSKIDADTGNGWTSGQQQSAAVWDHAIARTHPDRS